MGKIGLGCAAVLVVVLVVVGISLAGTYNRLVTLGQEVDKQWSQVENVSTSAGPTSSRTWWRRFAGRPSSRRKPWKRSSRLARPSVGRRSARDGSDGPGQLAQFSRPSGTGRRLHRLLVVVERYRSSRQRELPGSSGAARGNGEPDRGRTEGLQRIGTGLQHDPQEVPDEPDGGDARLQGEAILPPAPGSDRARRSSSISAMRHPAAAAPRRRRRRAAGGAASRARAGATVLVFSFTARELGRQGGRDPGPPTYVTDRAGVLGGRGAELSRSSRSSSGRPRTSS